MCADSADAQWSAGRDIVLTWVANSLLCKIVSGGAAGLGHSLAPTSRGIHGEQNILPHRKRSVPSDANMPATTASMTYQPHNHMRLFRRVCNGARSPSPSKRQHSCHTRTLCLAAREATQARHAAHTEVCRAALTCRSGAPAGLPVTWPVRAPVPPRQGQHGAAAGHATPAPQPPHTRAGDADGGGRHRM